MSSLLIVGLGNVGIRHLEGCLKIKKIKRIYAVEKSKKRINFCKSIFKNHIFFEKIFFKSNTHKISSKLAIISTNSNERFSIAKDLIKKNKIRNLILEKFLTNKMSDLKNFIKLTKSANIWINHIYRYQEAFTFLKKHLYKQKYRKLNILIKGNNLNVTSNLIHFVDYASFFMNDKVKISKILFSKKSKWSKSKKNYWEFNGEVEVLFDNSTLVKVKSENSQTKKIYSLHKIYNDKKIYEIKNSYNTEKAVLKFENKKLIFSCPFLSNSTYKEAEKILFKKKNIKLSKLNNIIFLYSSIIKNFLKNYNSFFRLKNNKTLPIT